MDNNYLQHYGVLGMRWGIRKSSSSSGSSKTSRKKNAASNNTKQKTSKPKKKKISELSDDELKAKINRLDLEKRYKDLSKSVNPNSTRGKDFTLRVLEKIGENTLVNLGTQAANKGLGTAINKIFGVDSNDTVKRIVNPNKGQSDKK